MTFLTKNEHQAYTSIEILQGLGYQIGEGATETIKGTISLIAINEALTYLVKRKKVKVKTIDGATGKEAYFLIS